MADYAAVIGLCHLSHKVVKYNFVGGRQVARFAVRAHCSHGRKALAHRWCALVGFLDNPPADLRARIIVHMKAWAKTANVQFMETNTDAQVRIARASCPPEVAGYWSYLGTDILSIPAIDSRDST